MIKVIVSDFSRVLLFPKDTGYVGGLNSLNKDLLDTDPNYDFWAYFKLNNDLLGFYDSLDLPVHIFTSETIQNHPALAPQINGVFASIISAKSLEISKTDPMAYNEIAKMLKVKPGDVLYIDDKNDNLVAARSAGFHTILFDNTNTVIDQINHELNTSEIGYVPIEQDIAALVRDLEKKDPANANANYARKMLIKMKLMYRELGWIDEGLLQKEMKVFTDTKES